MLQLSPGKKMFPREQQPEPEHTPHKEHMPELQMFSILIIDDEEAVLSSLKRFFGRYNYQLHTAISGEDGLAVLESTPVDLLILDLKMPGMDGFTVLKKARELIPNLKVIIQTGHGGVAEAVEALKQGASDFLEKGGSPEILKTRVGRLYEIWLLEQKNRELQDKREQRFDFHQLVGSSLKMTQLKDMIIRVAPTDTTVLIQGESGTGKELVARAIHHHSDRSRHAFVPVDCASISETVIESELFGHAKGAFTGADTATTGLIRAADKGTLFLDEIGELSMVVQAKFLRTIQERIVRPVGSTKSHPVDIRIIAATNRNLFEEVSEGGFRQDLFYRLSTITLTSPPLREREEDIQLLANHILANSKKPEQAEITIQPEARKLLEHYDWPGNVRELENVLKGALVFADENTIKPEDLPPNLGGHSAPQTAPPHSGTLASYELEAIKNALSLSGNNRRKAAEILDIAEATLYRKIKLYGL